MKIIGRKREKALLEGFLKSDEARFMALYGRRRVGKTYLIEEFFTNSKCIFFHSTGIKNGTMERQIEEFSKIIAKTFYGGAELKAAKDWFEVFENLTKAIANSPKNKKVVLFFDEFPWMVTSRSGLMKALAYFWNRHWHSNPNLKLIICGSAASWIIKKIVRNTGDLYKRVTDRMRLEPFTLAESQDFLKSRGHKLNQHQILKLYMAVGGIPLYLSKARKGLSADQIIDELCFSKDAFLFDEFEELFVAIFDNSEEYLVLMREIANSTYGIAKTKLIKNLKLKDGGTLTSRLKELEDCGFIISFVPYKKSSRGQYFKISDEYTAFYFKWIEASRNAISKLKNHNGYWLEKSKSASFNSWSGIAFEAVCFKHVNEIRLALNLSPSSLPYGWRYDSRTKNDKGAQIDLLFDRGDEAITICEIKYSETKFTIDKSYAQNLKNKLEVFDKKTKTTKQLFLSIISTNGLTANTYSDDLITSVVELKDLFYDD